MPPCCHAAPGYVLRLDSDQLDVRRFERLVEEAAAAEPAAAAGLLREALGLWRGPALADLAFEPFAQAAIARLEDLRLLAVERRIDADLALGQHATARPGARGARRRASACARASWRS